MKNKERAYHALLLILWCYGHEPKMLSVTSHSGTDSERKECCCRGSIYFSLLSLFRLHVS